MPLLGLPWSEVVRVLGEGREVHVAKPENHVWVAWLFDSLPRRPAGVAAMAVLAASLALAFGGSPPGPTLTVRIPFDFRAGESGFGPGEYVISLNREASQDGSTAGSVRLGSRDRGGSVTIHARRSRAAGSSTGPVVSFRVYGDQRFLGSVQAEDAGAPDGSGSRTGPRAWELDPSADEHSASLRWGAPTVLSLKADPPARSR